MTNDLNDLVPTQEKLEWVTPKISLMEAGDTEGSKNNYNRETTYVVFSHHSIVWSLLTDYTSNPSTPTKTNNTTGSLQTLF